MKNKLLPLFLLLLCQYAFAPVSHAQQTPAQHAFAQTPPPPPPPQQFTPALTHTLIDSLGQVLYKNYIFPDTARKWSAYLEAQYKKGAYAGIKDPNDLAERLQHDLQKTHFDGHLRLMYAPDFARDLADTSNRTERHRVGDSMQLIDLRQRNFTFTKAEILPGNIGYVKFNAFVGFLDEARPTSTGAFRFVANTTAVIIDLRDNGGGSPDMVSQIESYFFHTKTHLNDIINRKNDTIVFWTDPAKSDSVILQQPVYILTARRTFSGAEDFAYGMQSVRRATIVGDTTGGGAHPTGPVPAAFGFVVTIPFARSLNPYTHTDWEGTGVIPDIPVASADALEAAVKAIFTNKMQQASSEEEKRQAQWQLEDILARQSAARDPATRDPSSLNPASLAPATPDSASLAAYTGTFQGGLLFYADRSGLYCRNPERGGSTFKLIPISADKFILDENVHTEFTKDDKGKVSGFNMWWSNGRMSYKSKEK
jgi:retinol-binding protein 3